MHLRCSIVSIGKSESAGFMYCSVGDANVIPYLHKHITPAVKVFSQLVTFLLLGQDGLHLHHPGSYKHVVGLNIPDERRQQKESDSQILISDLNSMNVTDF